MLPILAAILAFITIGGLGWVFVGGDDSTDQAVKRAQNLGDGQRKAATARKAAAAANTPEARRKQIMAQLQEAERRERKVRANVSAKLKQAGLTISVRTFYIASAVVGLVVAVAALAFGLHVLLVLGVGIIAGLGLPRWVLGFLAKARIKKFSLEFPNAVDVIVRGIKSGLPIHECFKIIARESPAPLGPAFKKLVEALGVGMTLEQALDKMFEQMPTPELRFFTIVIAIQQKTGGNLAEALGNLSTVLRARRMMGEKVKAMSSEALASAGIIASLPPVVMGMVMITSPSYMMSLFTDIRGNFLLLVAAALMGIGVFVMKRMISFKI
ncbi:MAG: type II secretion system F family protein [Brevundimonas sp.]|uniref:type II secretion system F family protein n=1 Tax=Brevundimonas sp. TaxID=1871086 RepID=UPI002716A08B|nr:type II secretion system F family protein [Brevundimonas sp.]MDO9609892.1 type II secretion system F family protein [Brevundimonas sp.]